ncbi:hypothetical protein I6N95_05000 [Vagococcus sp. BWB3-3]|uniref:DUF3168 domain-containing protein n=1 Tax=Vagococcus allomyrinae TaxID=2794353 RepID=A0A940P9E6_9ENTE|nr:hypothetical protein [Vagococcus allomyrinae]MBP1040367.1 hypothetical protein [Vagococcus allomyrinae]
MIIDMTRTIVQTIASIPEAINWVVKVNKVPNISANKLPHAQYPAISVFESGNDPEMHADDEEQTSMITYQISLVSTDGSHGRVQNFIDSKMKEMGFIRLANVPILFDEKTTITNRVLLYTQEIEHSVYE